MKKIEQYGQLKDDEWDWFPWLPWWPPETAHHSNCTPSQKILHHSFLWNTTLMPCLFY